MNHTPTPWHYQEESDAYTHIIRSETGKYILGMSQLNDGITEANARYIVHCVNQHEKLIEALTALLYHSDYDEEFRPLQAKRIREAEKLIKQESEAER